MEMRNVRGALKVQILCLLAICLPLIVQAADKSFVFAGLSITPEAWDKAANMAKLERFATDAASRGADVIATPEGFLEGYVGNRSHSPNLTREEYASVTETLDGPLLTRVGGLARNLKVYLLVGFAERQGSEFYNSAVIFSPDGRVLSRYSKMHTGGGEPFNTKGSEFVVAETPYGPWGTLICYDRQLPETARILALRGAQFVLIPSWGKYGEMERLRMRVRAEENRMWIAFVHPKQCIIVDARGSVVAESVGEGDQIVMGRISLSPGKLQDRRPELYEELVRVRVREGRQK